MNAIPEIEVKIHKVFCEKDNPLRGVASATIGGAFVIHGIRLVDSKNGVFVSMPRRLRQMENGDQLHSDIFHPVTREARQFLHGKVLEAYQLAMEGQ